MKTHDRKSALLRVLCATILMALGTAEVTAQDIEVPFNPHTRHPAILLAWRNTQKIFEAEVLVANHSDKARNVALELVVTDMNGRQLMRRPEINTYAELNLPAAEFGGEEGSIVQIRGSRDANLIIDELDRQQRPYNVTANLFEKSGDSLLFIGAFTRTLHSYQSVSSSSEYQNNFTALNRTNQDAEYEIKAVTSNGYWGDISLCPKLNGGKIKLAAGEALECYVRVKTASSLAPGDLNNLTIVWVARSADGTVLDGDSREWLLTTDTSDPVLVNLEKSISDNGTIHFEAVVRNATSGIDEASGVRIDYSLDGGITFSNRIMAYLDGNFRDETRFLASIGPFVAGSKVTAWVTVTTGSGVTKRFPIGELRV